jgi:hypothetical protein
MLSRWLPIGESADISPAGEMSGSDTTSKRRRNSPVSCVLMIWIWYTFPENTQVSFLYTDVCTVFESGILRMLDEKLTSSGTSSGNGRCVNRKWSQGSIALIIMSSA